MKASEAAKLLADRVNQLHYVESIMEKVYKCGLRDAATIFTPPHTAQYEADVLFNKLGYHKSIQILEYTMLNLKAANVSTVWHEEVLTILKGM
jgi:hypothetical protein